jgi:hypothetical protein
MTSPDAPLAGRREWTALAVIALPCLLYSTDLSVLYLALPSLTAELRPVAGAVVAVARARTGWRGTPRRPPPKRRARPSHPRRPRGRPRSWGSSTSRPVLDAAHRRSRVRLDRDAVISAGGTLDDRARSRRVAGAIRGRVRLARAPRRSTRTAPSQPGC